MKRPSALDKDCNYYLFRDQLVPAWEVGGLVCFGAVDVPQWRLLDSEGEENLGCSRKAVAGSGSLCELPADE